FFAAVYGVFYLFIRKKERIALIEKGINAEVFNGKANFSTGLKYGIFCIGIAIGFLIGEILNEYTRINEGVAYLSMIFLFGGMSLVIYYFIARKHSS
nr:hypothetical protein [Bacteroidales bacterium]